MENKDDLARRIGVRVKGLRKGSGLTQKRLAEATGLSSGLLSRIENGLAMPSIPTLESIANCLRVAIGDFFKEGEKRYVVSRQGKRRVIKSKRGYVVEFLNEGMKNAFMEPAIVTTKREEVGEPVRMSVHGGQEFVYVLEGIVALTLGEKKIRLKKGDVAYFDGDIPHKGVSVGKKSARTLNVHLIPGQQVGTFESVD